MRDTVFQEYKETIHYKNRSGVRAICPDCHVPKDWTHKFVRKVQASKELYSKFIAGSIDTPEKFEAKRMELAEHVWATMKGERFARMPQLPLVGGDGSAQAEPAGARRRWSRRRRTARRASIATRASRTCCPRNTTRTISDARAGRGIDERESDDDDSGLDDIRQPEPWWRIFAACIVAVVVGVRVLEHIVCEAPAQARGVSRAPA